MLNALLSPVYRQRSKTNTIELDSKMDEVGSAAMDVDKEYDESDSEFKSWLMNVAIPRALHEPLQGDRDDDGSDECMNDSSSSEATDADLHRNFVRYVRLMRDKMSRPSRKSHPMTPATATNSSEAPPRRLSHLSDDIISTIFSHLSSVDLCRSVVPASRRFHKLSVRAAEERIGWHRCAGSDRRLLPSSAAASYACDNPTTVPSVVAAAASASVSASACRGSPRGAGPADALSASFVSRRTLPDQMHLLRAMEQSTGCVGGVRTTERPPPFVRIPMLCLPHPLLVSTAGDVDYNGIYFCTGCNGNGFVFTKPRNGRIRRPARKGARRRMARQLQMARGVAVARNGWNRADNDVNERTGGGEDWEGEWEDEEEEEEDEEEDVPYLRCIIAKKFSGEHIFWYMSKEIESVHPQPNVVFPGVANNATMGRIKQKYSYWARLQIVGDASLSVCRYPSQTSVLCRKLGEPGWQELGAHGNVQGQPPLVELL